MDDKIFIGIDTSNYTTSVCAFADGRIISKRKVLPVKSGQRGLRQSDAVFEHIRTLPLLYKELVSEIDAGKISAVGVSVRPRNIEGSYMPVFVAGQSFAEVISDTLGVPVYCFSHQEGHIAAAVATDGKTEYLNNKFLSVHLSGGTCEILKTEYKDNHFICDIAGKTTDISAGQFIDRVGVSMGLAFPCGRELEKIAIESKNPYKFPVSVKNNDISFSGVETKAQSLVGNISNSDLAMGVFLCIAETLKKAVMNVKGDISDILFVGGVAANGIIRKHMKLPMNVHFCSREYASDNAAGIAYLTMLSERGEI